MKHPADCRRARTIARRALAALAVALATGTISCQLPGTALKRRSAQQAIRASKSKVPARMASPSERLQRDRTVLHRMVTGDGLIEHLYLDWMAVPYQRATLAVAIKTIDVAQREIDLRGHGAGALTDDQLNHLLAWLDKALDMGLPRANSLSLNDIRVNAEQWLGEQSPGRPAALFAFADRSTFTQRDRWFGDFDLLACAGFRIYPVGRNRPLTAADIVALRRHADSLGIELIDAPLGAGLEDTRSALTRPTARIVPYELAELAALPAEVGRLSAVIDPVGGQSWAELAARRALYRGTTGRAYSVAVGLSPPDGPDRRATERMRAAMWVTAIDGQRLGVLEGWRDIRDGTPTPYPSRFTDPALLETAAHTALDILASDALLRQLQGPRRLVIRIEPQHIVETNRLSPELLGVVERLLSWQLSFDLCVQPPSDARTDVWVMDWNDPRLAAWGGEKELRSGTLHAGEAQRREWLKAARPVAIRERNGGLAVGVYVRSARDGHRVAVINLLDAERKLTIDATAVGFSSAEWSDELTGKACGESVDFAPYQVRILALKQTQ